MSAETLGPHQSSVTVDKQEKIAHMGEQLTQKKNDPRSDYLQKTNEEQVDFIIRGSSAPMEQPQKVAVADSGAGCTRERHMKSTELLLDGIDGLVGCFGFVQDCIHQVCERNIQEGEKKIEELKSNLDALQSSLQSLVFGEESGPGQTLLSKQVIDEQMSVNRCNGKVGEIVKKVKDLKEKFNIWEKERTKDCTGASERSTNSEQHQLDRIASTQQRVSSFTSYLTAYKIQSVVMKGCNEELKGGIAKRTNGLHGVVHALEEKELMAKKLVENERVIEELKERVSKLEEQKPRNSSEQVRYPEQTKDDSVGEYLPGAEAVYRPQEVPPDPRDSGVGKEQTDNYPSGAGVAPQTASDQVTPQSSKSEPVDKTQGKELSKSVSSPDTCTAPQEETGASTMAAFLNSFKDDFLKVVPAQDMASKFKDGNILPPAKATAIASMNDTSEARSCLYHHVHEQADYEVAKSLCKIMAEEKGYRNMNMLGEKMLESLKQNIGRLKQ